MNILKKLIKEIIFLIIFLIIGFTIVFAPAYFIKKVQDKELHQNLTEIGKSFVRLEKHVDENENLEMENSLNIWKALFELKQKLYKLEEKLNDNLNKSDEITDKTEDKSAEQKQE
ncbi:MAG: hypothetical protein Q8894_02565 [Sweet potato little leaf phytoplasma]|uniref:Uncharacterized protein n=1 Tax=Candidatus Phytoplasma fabacearum TaxID=2982628 RepID=A0ABU8ZSX9_9MOLU|nr:hypothetical protein [Candidatus Phytoplasma stylosanthis]MDV3143183.1 hypothetical protein [Sweet potato little leaf phytoplasma]MDV3158198.1 hypothetical protein [Pigeon pea little leaf phytoplasma]MDV3146602.1 hypothetical protein [Sweet potato little leaf phytoplasma]MDV3146790.1 hypothetical protein [Sweet potato little leaf phytoplasma]MDV3155258.1 hypothetical protein [Sweet potato little leaf phytoplasma]